MKNYESIFNYIWHRQKGMCLRYLDESITMKDKYYSRKYIHKLVELSGLNIKYRITELHHRYHKTKRALKLYPLFINSMLNLAGYSHYYHMKEPGSLKIRDDKAEKYQRFLERHSKLSKFVNGGFDD